ncbi:MAG: MerR family transcriptional regulator [Phenylobacterium sp.]|uniref:MerR family transcriptional regulator n=1 Tax=Phenylobacterium sp. TaxID=1871053 RepID=UPI00391BB8EC
MSSQAAERDSEPPLTIADVERACGLPKDTLRVWERRYGFPAPLRDANNERVYPSDQVAKLRLLSRLIDAGHRPGRIVALPVERLTELARETASATSRLASPDPRLARLLEMLRAHDVERLRDAFAADLLALGLERFVMDIVAPLTSAVGDSWAAGDLQVFHEHLYTEQVSRTLRSAMSAAPLGPGDRRPRVLLTTLPGESHGLGLLMVEALLSVRGCACVSLGVETPLEEVALAAPAHGVDIVALSFSAFAPARLVQTGLEQLRRRLPEPIELWAGGSAPSLKRAAPAGVVVVRDLGELDDTLAHWRRRAG